MTRESEKSKIRMSVIVDGKHINSLKKADEVIDKIFDEYEAQLKLASDVYSTDKMHMYQELKAKDEEIERLNCRAYHAEGYITDLHNEYPKHKKFLNKKARSIVAMLFWEWRRAKEFANSSLNKYDKGVMEGLRYSFAKAYKMLKDTK